MKIVISARLCYQRYFFLGCLLFSQASISIVYRPGPGATPGNGNTASLIAAITSANASPTDDIIDLEGLTYIVTSVCAGCPISGLPVIANNGKLAIINGALVRSFAAGTPDFTLINNLGLLYLSRVAIKNGRLNGSGGGIVNINRLEMDDCVISYNTSLTGNGGGISSGGTLIINNSLITRNSAPDGGGGINLVGGTTSINNSTISDNLAANNGGSGGGGILSFGFISNISNSTISGNQAPFGGGIRVNSNSIGTIDNSTIANNTATLSTGGGIQVDATRAITLITNSTFSGNQAATNGGGIFNAGTIGSVFSNIVAGNLAAAGADIYNTGSFPSSSSSEGYNLVVSTFGTTITNGVNNDLVIVLADLFLGPLQDNGGTTYTMALLPASLAINNGYNPLALDFDQRGYPYSRVSCARPDIGAYEFQLCSLLAQ